MEMDNVMNMDSNRVMGGSNSNNNRRRDSFLRLGQTPKNGSNKEMLESGRN